MRTRRNRRTSLLAAGALLLAGLAAGLALDARPAPAQAADEDVTFTVGVLTDADSFNPFVGIKATSFEMWALTYDYLISYSTGGHVAAAGASRTRWDTSDDGLTWTFHLRDDVDLLRRGAADRRRRRAHVQPDHGRRPRGRDLGLLPRPAPRASPRPTRPDRRADAEEAARDAAAVADPDRPRAHLEGRQREGRQDLQGRAGGRRAGGRLRPVPPGLRRGQRRDLRVRREPGLLERRAEHRPRRVPRLQVRGPDGRGAEEGRARLRRRHHPAPGAGARGRAGHHRAERRLAGLRRDRVQRRRRVDPETGEPIGRRQPGAPGPGVPPRARLRASTSTS